MNRSINIFGEIGDRAIRLFLWATKRRGSPLEGVIVQIGIIVTIMELLMWATPLRFAAFMIAAVGWVLILCFGGALSMWFLWLRKNTAVVLERPIGVNVPKRIEGTRVPIIKDGKELEVVVGPAIISKKPNQVIVNSKVVNMMRSITLSQPVTIITKDEIECSIKWVMFLSVIQCEEAIIHVVEHNEEKIVKTFETEANAFVESIAKTFTVDEIFEVLSIDMYDEKGNPKTKQITKAEKRLSEGFSNLYWGDDKIHPTEAEMGMRTSKLIIAQFRIDEEYVRAIRSKKIAEERGKGMDSYIKRGVSSDAALNMVASDGKVPQPANVNSNTITVNGKNLPPNTTLVIGDISTQGSRGSKKT